MGESSNGNEHSADTIRPLTSPESVTAQQVQQIAEMRAAASLLVERLRFARVHGLQFEGARDLYEVLGYDRIITNRQYREKYARGGIAGRIIDAFPNATWRGTMEIVEDLDPHTDTPFEKAWKDLEQRLQITAKLSRVDKLSQLSPYAVLLIGAPGSLDTELPRGNANSLVYLSAFSGGGGPGDNHNRATLDADVTIESLDTDTQSPRFGLPLMYRIKRPDIQSTELLRPVHWTRVIHVAEGCLFDDVYGTPSLERVWNLLGDLEKITGGGAEAFWLRANQGLHLNIDPTMSLPDANNAVEALKQQAEEYKHQLTRWLRTRGVEINTLGSDVANFESPADAVLTQIAGAKAIPKRILTGSEMGELASSQDRDNWKDQINGRQTQYAGPYIVRPFVNRLIEYGYLAAPKGGPLAYEVKWPNIQTLTEGEKSNGAQQWASTAMANGQPVFTDDEIREKWYGMAPLTEEQKTAFMPQPVAPTLPDINSLLPAANDEDADKEDDTDIDADLNDDDDDDDEDDDDEDIDMPKKSRKRAASAPPESLVTAIEDAIKSNNVELIDRLLGLNR